MADHTPNGVSPYVLVSSPGMKQVAESVKSYLAKGGLDFPHHTLEMTQFANGEILPRAVQTIRQQHVFFFHALQYPDPNTALMTMFLACDAMARASVTGITLVIPYIPYLRQDRKDKPRVPISARLIADLIQSNRMVKRVITIDMHAEQEQGFFSIPVDNLTSRSLFVEHLQQQRGDAGGKLVAVAADFGGTVRTKKFAEKAGDIPVVIFEKKRPAANKSEVVSIVGEIAAVEGATVAVYEDMIDTGGTLRGVVNGLKQLGAADFLVYATHGIFSGGAEAKFAEAGFRVFVTNSIPRSEAYMQQNPWLTMLPIDELLANVIHEATVPGGSVSRFSL